MMKRALGLALFILIPGTAMADDPRAAVRAACKADVGSHCGTVFSRDKAIACLIDNAGALTTTCVAALKSAACNDKAPDNLKGAFPCAD